MKVRYKVQVLNNELLSIEEMWMQLVEWIFSVKIKIFLDNNFPAQGKQELVNEEVGLRSWQNIWRVLKHFRFAFILIKFLNSCVALYCESKPGCFKFHLNDT